MKKILLIVLLGVRISYAQTLTSGTNAIMEQTPREAMTSLTGSSYNTVQSTIQYFDKLGRPSQSIVYRGNADAQKDLILSTTQYDAFGRAYKSILPTPSDVQTGGFNAASQSLAATFYGDTSPFTETIFEASPANRPVKGFGAGQTWRTNNKYVSTKYLIAGANEMPLWNVTATGATKNGSYGAGQLLKTETTSEQGNKVIEYKDKEGKIIRKDVEYATGNFMRVFNIYDDFDRLRYVVQPEAYETLSTITSFDESSTVYKEGIFGYKYDALGRVVESHIVGAGTKRFVYDKNDRVILENDDSDAAQNPNYYKFTKYDALGRVVQAGLVFGIGGFSRSQLQTAFDNHPNLTYEERGNDLEGYTNRSFPSSYTPASDNLRTVTYYDDYSFNTDANYNFQAENAFHSQANAKGLVTGTLVRNLETNVWYKYVNYYDYKGRVIQVFSQNHLGGIDRTDYQYRFNGELLKMKIVHNNSIQSFSELYEYTYNHIGQKVRFTHTKDGVSKNVAKYEYNAIGQMKSKLLQPVGASGSKQNGNWTDNNTWLLGEQPTISDNVTINAGHTVTIPNGQIASAGSLADNGTLNNLGTLQMGSLNANSTTLQTIDYTYHIRGGLKGINLDASGEANLSGNKLFSFKLGYEEDGSFHDGNIRSQTWVSAVDNIGRAYFYDYDGASRIVSGTYAGGKYGERYSLHNVSYDKNGNITALKRSGLKSDNTFGVVDDLVYSYQDNSNKIKAVTDNEDQNASFVDATGTTDYTYSADGSLISDANKGISSIEYNYLKLPRRIVQGSTVILNEYDATGKKLKQTIGTDVTHYLDNIIYKNNVLYQSSHDEGRIVNGEYEYFINDHLGSLRVAFRDSLGVAKISQKQDYDPWGAELRGISYLKNSWKQSDIKFSGKEFIQQTNLNDFGWRQQDPILGRMWGVDNRAEKYYSQSPMQFALNNPISFIEVDGDTTQYYDINNNSLISTINDASSLNRIKINRHIYDNVFAQYSGVDLTNQNNAFAFVGNATYLAQEIEEATGINVLAQETGTLSMDFIGSANPDNPKEANGSLNVNSHFDDGSKLNVASYSAIGGPWGNGSPENGNYSADNLRVRNSPDGMIRNGVGFSMDLNPSFNTGRSLLRIHPDGGNYTGTQGCIGLQCTGRQLTKFYNSMNRYLQNHSNIGVSVNIEGNPNNNGRSNRRRRNNGE